MYFVNVKDAEAQFNTVAVGQDNELFRSCAFDSESEGVFLSGISSLGEVKTQDDPTLKEPVSAHQVGHVVVVAAAAAAASATIFNDNDDDDDHATQCSVLAHHEDNDEDEGDR
jgi:hypothetical protein